MAKKTDVRTSRGAAADVPRGRKPGPHGSVPLDDERVEDGLSLGGGRSAPESLAIAQGAFYVATGVWPLLSMRSFEAVTGPKTDRWLVRTVGSLVAVAGAALVSAGLSRRVTPEVALLGAGSAAALGAIDAYYASRGRISRVYLADAAAEAALIAGWARAARQIGRGGDEADDGGGRTQGRGRDESGRTRGRGR